MNTYRSLCDARGQASIVLHKDKTGVDEIVIDLSPLRCDGAFYDVGVKCIECQPGGEIFFGKSNENNLPTISEHIDAEEIEWREEGSDILSWSERPIYQLPPYYIAWRLPRGEAKAVGKKLASLFDTVENAAVGSKKPIDVKHGKGRRHGGYGIG